MINLEFSALSLFFFLLPPTVLSNYLVLGFFFALDLDFIFFVCFWSFLIPGAWKIPIVAELS